MTTTRRLTERVSLGTTSSGYLPPRPPQPAPPRRPWRLFLGALVLAVVAASIGALVATVSTDDPAPTVIRETVAVPGPAVTSSPTPATTPAPAGAEDVPPATSGGVDPALVGATVIPSIVTVEVGAGVGGDFVAQGSGSGVVIDEAGYVVTNDHVAGDASAVRVVFPDGTVFQAELVGTDPVTDLAVVRVEATDLVPIAFGSSDALSVGDPAIAVGSPLGLEGGPSLSVGVISAVGREVQTDADSFLYGMLQTDAPITSGSSGGALVDGSGALIGITTAVGVSNIGVEGIGFATPVEVVERVVSEIIATGEVSHAFLGITGSTAYRTTDDGGLEPIGVTVQSISPDSAASTAGLGENVVITSVGEVQVRTMDELITAFRRLGVGETVTLDFAEGSSVEVTLGEE